MAAKVKRATPSTIDAVDVALERAGDEAHARTLLEKHGRLIDAQVRTERLEHRNKLALIAFRSILAAGALALILGFAWMVMNARADRGLVIEALSVPPDLAQRGLTGEAIASNLADKLADIDRTARSFRSPETMTVNWGNDVKIQIPETGVSIGEVDAFLRRALGHQTTIGGAVFRTPQGLRLTVRVGGSGAVEQTGNDANLEAMIQKAAEGVFAKTQAYRYSKYLEFTGRTEEAMKVARDLAATTEDPKERAWAWAQITNLLLLTDTRGAVDATRRALREDPTNPLVYLNGAIAYGHLGQFREFDRLSVIAIRYGANPKGGLSDIGVNTSRSNAAFDPARVGDFNAALKRIDALSGPVYAGIREGFDMSRAGLRLSLHDVRASRRFAAGVTDQAVAARLFGSGVLNAPQYDDAIEVGDYPHAVALARQVLEFLKTNPETPHLSALASERYVRPRLAAALAFAGNTAEAKVVVDALPLDCTPCVVARSIVAGTMGDLAAARRWNDEAIRQGDLPVSAWARMARISLDHHRWKDALADADRAVAAGPKFADGHKLRGDALRRLRRYDEAVAQYRTAAKIAPQWGRLHVDWGMAEAQRGNPAEAHKQFAAAQKLFLSATDQRVLAAVRPLVKG